MADDIKTIDIPRVTFAFGDAKWRVLYGPENEHGARSVIGVIDVAYVEQVQTMLDYADANMPTPTPEDR